MKKYLVIGNPIDHSLSPRLHNFWIQKNSIEAHYDKKEIKEKDIKEIIVQLKKDQIQGINVTVPFKKSVIPFLDELSKEAKKSGSVNTIYKENNKVIGHNTDIGGFELGLRYINYNIKGKKILVLGAGGVAPSIILALKKMEASEILLSNRTKKKSFDLKNIFPYLKIIEWGEIPDFDVIINATSIGLKENEEIKINYNKINSNKLFYDVIYNPIQTKFLQEANKLGHRTENGKMMFIYQAHQAFTIWHKIMPTIDEEVIRLID
jgi:shikimate dehydrogenase